MKVMQSSYDVWEHLEVADLFAHGKGSNHWFITYKNNFEDAKALYREIEEFISGLVSAKLEMSQSHATLSWYDPVRDALRNSIDVQRMNKIEVQIRDGKEAAMFKLRFL